MSTYTQAAYDNEQQLKKFAAAVDVITYEFENVPAKTAALLASLKPVFPPPRALEISQDRLSEKEFVKSLGLPLPAFHAVASEADLEKAVIAASAHCVLKTRRFGYDGKGQAVIRSAAEAQAAFRQLKSGPCVLEAFITLEKEISVIAVQGQDGETAVYDVIENVHRNHILHTSTMPAKIPAALELQAKEAALKIIAALDYVGVLAVEFFVDKKGNLLINETAPRVHNSGHLTMDACHCCQFENHIRAIAGWPLGPTARAHNAVMTNLIGDEVNDWQKPLSDKENCLWLYGKSEARPGRKMGHITRISPLA